MYVNVYYIYIYIQFYTYTHYITISLYIYIYTGWWYTYPSEKYEVSWDDDIPNIWNNNPNVPNHKSVINKAQSAMVNPTPNIEVSYLVGGFKPLKNILQYIYM